MVLLAWPLFAFGGVYLWAAIPFVLGGMLFAVLCPPRARDGERADDLSASELKRVWKHVIGTTTWWMTLEPYEPAQIERLYKLARRHEWEVLFLTKRPQTEGDSVQFQTQWWIEHHGFYLPSPIGEYTRRSISKRSFTSC